MEKYYITTPIYYASGTLHLGHCYTTVLADCVARYNRSIGRDVFFLTGSDEHGLKIETNAKAAGLSPQGFVDKIVDGFKDVWRALNITYDKFIRTSDASHMELVKKIFKKLYDQGDIYKGEYKGLYCVPCETYFAQSDLVDGKCPDCGRPVSKVSEPCYFFRLSKYQKWLEEFYESHPDFLVPEARKNEIFNNFIKPGISDLCVTRTTFDWGVKVDFDTKHVIYVWIDALLNYISAIGYGSEDEKTFQKYWPADIQFIGRDITRFHAIIWPILLHAIGLPMPKLLHSHGFVTQKGDKISKSKGGGFDPITLCNRYGADAVRYWLIKDGPIYQDAPYTSELFIKTINSDLCNNLGNLLSRTLAMIEQNFDSVPKADVVDKDVDNPLIDRINNLDSKIREAMADARIDLAINEIFALVADANKYVDVTMPWALSKNKDMKRLSTVLYNLYFALGSVAYHLQSFLPDTAAKMASMLAQKDLAKFKEYNTKLYGAKVSKGEALFARLNVEDELKYLESIDPKAAKVEQQAETVNLITIDDFDKIDLRVGQILDSEKIEGSDKLLKNTVKIGDETRIIVSGIAKYYNPKELVGKSCVVVTNLKPIKLRGVESRGMILCASDDDGNLKIICPDGDIKSGGQVN